MVYERAKYPSPQQDSEPWESTNHDSRLVHHSLEHGQSMEERKSNCQQIKRMKWHEEKGTAPPQCYNTSFSILSPFHIMCSITWSAVSLIQHCCAMPHGYHMLLCNASLITHVEHSGTTYIRIPWNASLLTHVLQLVYIVRSLDCNLSHILLSYPL